MIRIVYEHMRVFMVSRVIFVLLIAFFAFPLALDAGSEPAVELTPAEREYLQNLGPITMGVDPDWVPFELLHEDGSFTGIAADLVELVATRLGITFEIVPTADWAETIAYSREGKFELADNALYEAKQSGRNRVKQRQI